MPKAYKFITICGIKVDIGQISDVIEFIENRVSERSYSLYRYYSANAVVCAKNNLQLRTVVNNADLSIADDYSLYIYYAIRHLKKCNSEFIKLVLVGVLSALVFWHVMALFFDAIDSPPTSIFLWIFIGLIFAAVKKDR